MRPFLLPFFMEKQRPELRRELRRRRRGLTSAERLRAAHAVRNHLQSLLPLRSGLRLGVYLAFDGELDTQPIIDLARRRGCHLFVPILHRYRPGHGPARLRFVPLEPPLRRNCFGILEPADCAHRYIDARWLDAVLVPLVGFGRDGARLGSGAGFYDQTFAFLRRRRTWKKPRFIGLAYRWQAVPKLAMEAWDVALSAVVTDAGVQRFANRGMDSRSARESTSK